jgi:hypothetical protein
MYSGTNGPLALAAKGNLEFNYTALSLAIPGRVLFRYRLEGLDTGWQSAGTRRQAFYTNLSRCILYDKAAWQRHGPFDQQVDR